MEKIGKQYHIGRKENGHRSPRDVVAHALVSPFRRAARLLRGQGTGAADLDQTFELLGTCRWKLNAAKSSASLAEMAAGESTLLKILSRITEPTEAIAEIR